MKTSSSSPWSTPTTRTPPAAHRAAQPVSRGHSRHFRPGARSLMHRATWNKMIANTNQHCRGGKRGMGLSSITSIGDVNRILAGEGLPQVEINDTGFLNDGGTFVPYIADNKPVIAGRRTDG